MLFHHHKPNLNRCLSSSNKTARSWNLHEFDDGTYLFRDGAQLITLPTFSLHRLTSFMQVGQS